MSMRTLESKILKDARALFCNPKLKLKEILEWSTGEVKPEAEDEVVARLADLGVDVCIKKSLDKRPPA